jgi:alkaline phosphatase
MFLPFRSVLLSIVWLTGAASAGAEEKAKNVILFLGDAGGIPTLNAAGIYAHDRPLSLFVHSMPHVALSETSARDAWVTDSAAGMTAIVTGRKTNNRMLSVVPGANGATAQPLKTILEYAEEHGLATGVITNMAAWDATPAACYAHVDSRGATQEIYRQLLRPRFGDGVDILVGKDRKAVEALFTAQGKKLADGFAGAGYRFFDTPGEITADAHRAVSIYDGEDFAPIPVVDKALQSLGSGGRGFFLMIEWDMHTDNTKRGLDRAIVMDDLIRHVAGRVANDTMILFTADHSFGLRLRGGKPGSPFADQFSAASATEGTTQQNHPLIAVEKTHTGEEVLVAAQGAGAERVHGFLANTDLFKIMMQAYGWKEDDR